ncbi:MAG: 4-hydroxythreonine-4-phosphate dehydrogenase PdxA [Dehalococcoidia bacterium]
MAARPRIAITMGDPSGIGPEVVAKALSGPDILELADLTVVGSRRVLEQALAANGISGPIIADDESGDRRITVLDDSVHADPEFPSGELSVTSARAAHHWIEEAVRLTLSGRFDGIVTAPINKTAFAMAGISDTGHQEILKRMSGAALVATMLISGRLRCVHLSTHKSLRDACLFVTKENVLNMLRLTDEHFRKWGIAEPRIGVAALNPHASDAGLIGREEFDEIEPAIRAARLEGIVASGPHPADSVFNQAIAGKFDVVLVMYHDQGHIAIKVHGFEQSISVNLGLPFVRTSVDHGTAFDIAGQGVADATSMVEAIRTAASLVTGSGLREQ